MKNYLVVLILTTNGFIVQAQEKLTTHNNDLWFLLHGNYTLSDKFGLDSEIHLRLGDMGGQKQQILLRPSIFYKYNKQIRFYVGYTYISSYPYGDQPIKSRTPENNIWIQVLMSHSKGNLNFSHRYRLEQRWIGNISSTNNGYGLDGTIHKNRIRYRLTTKFRIPTDLRFYFTAFDEIWINYGKNVGFNYLDQNWLYAGTGFYLSEFTTIELAYQWQLIRKSDGMMQEYNNTLQVSLHYNLPLNRK